MEHFHIREYRFFENGIFNGDSLFEEARKVKKLHWFPEGPLPAWHSNFYLIGTLCVRLVSQLPSCLTDKPLKAEGHKFIVALLLLEAQEAWWEHKNCEALKLLYQPGLTIS